MADIADVHSRDDSPTIADDQAYVAQAEGETTVSPSAPKKRGSILKRVGLTLLALIALVVVLAFVAYNFGSMEPPTAQVRAQYDTLVASGKVAPVPSAGFHVPIPGCKCHSSDPVLQMKHAGRRIRNCQSCHGNPEGPAAAEAALTGQAGNGAGAQAVQAGNGNSY